MNFYHDKIKDLKNSSFPLSMVKRIKEIEYHNSSLRNLGKTIYQYEEEYENVIYGFIDIIYHLSLVDVCVFPMENEFVIVGGLWRNNREEENVVEEITQHYQKLRSIPKYKNSRIELIVEASGHRPNFLRNVFEKVTPKLENLKVTLYATNYGDMSNGLIETINIINAEFFASSNFKEGLIHQLKNYDFFKGELFHEDAAENAKNFIAICLHQVVHHYIKKQRAY
jgi:hypothetical protein